MTTISGHLTDAMAQRLVDGLPDPERDAGAEAHAAGCPACAALVESYRLLGGALDDLEVPALPAGFTASVLERIDRVEAARSRERRLAVAVLAGSLALAAGALVAAGVGGLASTVGGLADGLGQAAQALRLSKGVLPALLSALRLPLLVGAAAVAVPLLFGLTRLMPAPRTETI
jgi:anti-sigma factor RsiW